MNINDVYQENKKLDDYFANKYKDTESLYHEKNCLELIIELSEFINESKKFKYWTVKTPNMDDVIEEAADTLLMILYMYNYYNIPTVELTEIKNDSTLIYQVNDLYKLASKLMDEGSSELVERMCNLFIAITKQMGISENDLIESCFRKIEINKERLNSDY